MSDYQRQWYLKNRERLIQKSRDWRDAHPDRFRKLQQESASRTSGRSRQRYRLKAYPLSPEQIEALSTAQDHVCGICGLSKPLFPNLDQRGAPRGLLCRHCATRVEWVENYRAIQLEARPIEGWLDRGYKKGPF